MLDETSLKRPLLLARTRRVLVTASVITGVVFAGGIVVGATLHNVPRVERISAPAAHVTVDVPQVAPPAISINVQPPAAMPEPPAAEPLPPPRSPVPRPRVPHLWPQCVLAAADIGDGACTWDDGFPAISSDGTLIASKYIPDDGGRGNPGLSIRFIDTTTGKDVKTVVVLSPEEYVANDEDMAAYDRLQKKVASRVADVERTLDAGTYRTMVVLGGGVPFDGADETSEPRPAPTTIYAEVGNSGAARIIDPATNTVIWQRMFGVDDPSPITDDDDGGMCPGWGLRMMSLWWDPTTRVVLSTQQYRTGGCMCSDATYEQVVRVP